MSKVDEAEVKGDSGQDKTSAEASLETKATSQSTEASQKKAKTEAELRSDQRAEEGRQVKSLQEKLDKIEAELSQERKEKLVMKAGQFGKDEKWLQENEISTVQEFDKVVNLAKSFGATLGETKSTFKPDSGRGSGVGKIPWDEVKTMPDKELNELLKKSGATRLQELVEKGVVGVPR